MLGIVCVCACVCTHVDSVSLFALVHLCLSVCVYVLLIVIILLYGRATKWITFGAGFLIKVYISTINFIPRLQLYCIDIQICMLYFFVHLSTLLPFASCSCQAQPGCH